MKVRFGAHAKGKRAYENAPGRLDLVFKHGQTVSIDFSGNESHVALHSLRNHREKEHGLGRHWDASWVSFLSGDKIAAMLALGLQEIKRTYVSP